MSLPKNLAHVPTEELVDLLHQHVFETNLLMRSLVLLGVPVNADIADRLDPVGDIVRPEIILHTGDVSD